MLVNILENYFHDIRTGDGYGFNLVFFGNSMQDDFTSAKKFDD